MFLQVRKAQMKLLTICSENFSGALKSRFNYPLLLQERFQKQIVDLFKRVKSSTVQSLNHLNFFEHIE
jgi:hypothetical protein